MELKDDAAVGYPALSLDTARHSRRVIDEVHHVPSFKNLWMIPRAQQASQGFESADILFTRHKLL